MGEVLFHTGLAVKVIDGVGAADPRHPGRPRVIAVVAGTVFLGDLRLHDRHHRDAGQPDAAGDARARLSPDHRAGPIMAIGAVDMLIPPSALTVLLGSLSGISISKLLSAASCPA